MFSKAAALFTITLAAFAVAAPAAGDHTSYSTDCNSGSIQCCDQLHTPTSAEGTQLAGLIGVATGALSGQLGAECNPIDVCSLSAALAIANLVGVDCTPLTGQI